MSQNFIGCDREQVFLMPPSLREWLPADHLAWFVIDAVAEMDLSAFYGAYRQDGHGRAAYEPSLMVALVLYAYAAKQRSSRAIECHCRQDIAYRVITANLVPDHATVARFIDRHQDALAEVFGAVLALCAKAGLVRMGVVSIDGTKIAANASRDQSLDYRQIAKEIVEEGKATDRAEDERYGDARGDELPEQVACAEGRRAFLRDAKRELDAERDGAAEADAPGDLEAPEEDTRDELDAPEPRDAAVVPVAGVELGFELDLQGLADASRGRRVWLREARRQLDEHRRREAAPIPRSRPQRRAEAQRRLEQELECERRANEAYEQYRANGRMRDGRRFGTPPKPYQPAETPQGEVNLTDPDARLIKARRGFVLGYNAQAAVDENQIVLAAEIEIESGDFGHFEPMVNATQTELGKAGVTDTPQVAAADAGYWNEQQIDNVVADRGIQVLIPPDGSERDGERPGWQGGRYSWMRTVLSTPHAQELYRHRKMTVEPMFGHTKHNRGYTRFHRRGRAAVRTEWRLIAATHNLAKLHKHRLAVA
jgi:transposase